MEDPRSFLAHFQDHFLRRPRRASRRKSSAPHRRPETPPAPDRYSRRSTSAGPERTTQPGSDYFRLLMAAIAISSIFFMRFVMVLM
ncbi:hypothetical protein D7X55_42595, partial [Corallococcus sp. AB049A]